MRELGFKRVLFLVHRGQLARQTKKSYEKEFAKSVSMGLVGAGYHEYDADYVFATVQTLNRDEHLLQFDKDTFDCIVLDEAHHVTADTYQKIMKHFSPKLWLGMTATPDKRDDNVAGRNVYELFNYQIAYEIRLQQAMEENLLCPFHYFGITDLSIVGDDKDNRNFSMLTSDERVKHIIRQANYYGYSGEKVKGLIFCSSIKETQELSHKFNNIVNPDTGKYFRTIALNGDARSLNNRGCEVTVYPAYTKAEEILESNPDGIMLSNGPGDPKECVEIIEEIKKLYNSNVPIFAICLGHQLMALATGADTHRLKYGHRGANHPVKDLKTGKCYISSQNHGYVVDESTLDSKVAVPAFENVNDKTNEGLEYVGKNIFTVQFHPEACAGPQDTAYLFDRFMDMMKKED